MLLSTSCEMVGHPKLSKQPPLSQETKQVQLSQNNEGKNKAVSLQPVQPQKTGAFCAKAFYLSG